MKICTKCYWNFQGRCANVHYGVNCDETPVNDSCESFRTIPRFLQNYDKRRILNPKDYTEEMELSDQGYKRCYHCNEIIDNKLEICDSCGAVL